VTSSLVTVICLCHNHARFVNEALESVVSQSYKNIQLLIVDDASTDGSKEVIGNFLKHHPEVTFVSHAVNLGVCKAFNSGLELARGEFVIDFSADDVLVADRVEIGVAEFQKHDQSFGVQFGDAMIIDEDGATIGYHSDKFPVATIAQGDIYSDLVKRYFVDGPTTMVRKQVFDQLGGYDESLEYEDFDFWIRSSRNFKYFYTPTVLVKQRLVKGGLHERQFTRRSRHAWSTLAVCRKILHLNRNKAEHSALTSRLWYEIRQSTYRGDFMLAFQYMMLLKENGRRIFDL
jgi:glycosyltransferase involved in cell wall biosynthesis